MALRSDESLHAPHLIDVEVTLVLRRWERRGAMNGARGQEALEDLAATLVDSFRIAIPSASDILAFSRRFSPEGCVDCGKM